PAVPLRTRTAQMKRTTSPIAHTITSMGRRWNDTRVLVVPTVAWAISATSFSSDPRESRRDPLVSTTGAHVRAGDEHPRHPLRSRWQSSAPRRFGFCFASHPRPVAEPRQNPELCSVFGVTRFVVDRDTLLRIAAGEIEVAAEHQLVAPTLVRSQALSALYEAARRGEISADEGIERVTRINSLKVRFLGDKVLQRQAWKVADPG